MLKKQKQKKKKTQSIQFVFLPYFRSSVCSFCSIGSDFSPPRRFCWLRVGSNGAMSELAGSAGAKAGMALRGVGSLMRSEPSTEWNDARRRVLSDRRMSTLAVARTTAFLVLVRSW